ncbi:FAD-dependent oxidoreductase, partial [Pseudomonas sp. FW305-3-2-15-E-TSA4]
EIITGKVTSIDHANRTVNVDPELGDDFTLEYDHIVMAAGSVPRALPIPGLAEEGIGFKTIEEAVTLRDHVLARLDEAAVLT